MPEMLADMLQEFPSKWATVTKLTVKPRAVNKINTKIESLNLKYKHTVKIY